MTARLELTFNDNTVINGKPQTAHMKVHGMALTTANIDDQNSKAVALKNALVAISIGQLANYTVVSQSTDVSKAPASSTLAQRGVKWLIKYEDTVTHKIFRTEEPCADLTKLVSGQELLDLSAGLGLALKTAFEAYVISDAGNAVAVASVQAVQR